MIVRYIALALAGAPLAVVLILGLAYAWWQWLLHLASLL